ncbi:MAG: nuclear transport factor 2 family protein [Gammaproteobacteria bacterium]
MSFALPRITLLFALVCVVSCTTPPLVSPEEAPSFQQTLAKHIAAVTDRDLLTYQSTLTDKDDLLLIFPNGKPIETTAGVVDFHRDWFKDKNWIYEPEVVKVIEGSDMATAVIKYDYRDNAQGEPRSSWLVMVFQLENNEWRLVHDQNTRID